MACPYVAQSLQCEVWTALATAENGGPGSLTFDTLLVRLASSTAAEVQALKAKKGQLKKAVRPVH
jgi:hypothetical protein